MAGASARTLCIANVRHLAETVGTLPLVESTTLETGCDLDTTFATNHLGTLGTVFVVVSCHVLLALLVPTHLGTRWVGEALGVLVVGEVHGYTTSSFHKVGRVLATR
ncbi:hypothetical protein HG530_010175 [Fusarium avenaceum]|nr:hypothetical protein HG530_010175 [Fusarium avenaceum]